MRILIFSHNLIERGNYFRAMRIAGQLAEKGHDVTFMPSSHRWYKTNKYLLGKVKVIESPSWSFLIGNDEGWSPFGIMYRLSRVIRKKYDIVYGFSHKPVDFIPALFSRIFRGSFYITDWCDWWGRGGLLGIISGFRKKNPRYSSIRKAILSLYDKSEARLEEFVPKRAQMVTVICKALHERAIGIGIKKDKILHLISGAELEKIRPMEKEKARDAIRLSSYLPASLKQEDAIILGYIANYHLDEDLILETVSRVYRKLDNAILLVVGADFLSGKSKMERWGLRIFRAAPGKAMAPEDNILHFGRRPFSEMPAFLGACDILLLPMTGSIYNKGRWPHKIGDYLASGRPIVVNDVGDIPELVRKGNAGDVAAPEPADFSEKIIALAGQKNKWASFGKNARKTAELYLDWKTIGEKLEKKIGEIIPKPE